MRARAVNLLVFREDRRCASGSELKLALMRDLEKLRRVETPRDARHLDRLIGALLRAGELECAVADAADGSSPSLSVEPCMRITDRLAEALVARESAVDCAELRKILDASRVPAQVEIAPAEGFAYYALHPLAFAEVLDNISPRPASAAVIGIRTIGTTLSAVTAAAARDRGVKAERITVRPVGHPYDRRTQFSPVQREFVQRHLACGAGFLIVDEGPGLSGSSFLSVAEALVAAGVLSERIILLCGREPDFDLLCADNGPQRARRFRWIAVSSSPRKPAAAESFVGGGEWRKSLFRVPGEWPASWISFERLKYLSSADSAPERLFKFAGLGHYGEQVREREERVAGARFGVGPRKEENGFVSYPWMKMKTKTKTKMKTDGRPMSAEDLCPRVLARLAAYCAFRAESFAREPSGLSALGQMAEHNLYELGFERPVRLTLERPVLADGRMQPHEWLLMAQGEMLKTDSGSHGDDHFFPGITDIAWDLAGAIVEWKMSAGHTEAFLEAYLRASGDDAACRIDDFIAAYAVFRCAYCRMAGNALAGAEEQARLERAANEYRIFLSHRSQHVPLGQAS
ncbi:MAG TPA: hypothetical protein VI488_19135 [Candidatus Angelobacter sp.]